MLSSVDRLLALRALAAGEGDVQLVVEIDAQLAREGYQFTAVADGLERAVPRRGRPRKDTNA